MLSDVAVRPCHRTEKRSMLLYNEATSSVSQINIWINESSASVSWTRFTWNAKGDSCKSKNRMGPVTWPTCQHETKEKLKCIVTHSATLAVLRSKRKLKQQGWWKGSWRTKTNTGKLNLDSCCATRWNEKIVTDATLTYLFLPDYTWLWDITCYDRGPGLSRLSTYWLWLRSEVCHILLVMDISISQHRLSRVR